MRAASSRAIALLVSSAGASLPAQGAQARTISRTRPPRARQRARPSRKRAAPTHSAAVLAMQSSRCSAARISWSAPVHGRAATGSRRCPAVAVAVRVAIATVYPRSVRMRWPPLVLGSRSRPRLRSDTPGEAALSAAVPIRGQRRSRLSRLYGRTRDARRRRFAVRCQSRACHASVALQGSVGCSAQSQRRPSSASSAQSPSFSLPPPSLSH